jgi:hypothetical protein
LQKSKKYKASFIWRVVRSIGELALNDYAKKMNYGQGWVYRQCQQLNESTYKNYQL